MDWASSSNGLFNRCYKPPHGDAGSTRLDAVTQECGSNTQLCSQGIPMPGNARPPPQAEVGSTSKNRNVGSNKIYVPGASLCPGMRGQHPQHGDTGSTRLGAVTQECGSNTQLCSQGIPMPGNAIHGIEAVSTSHLRLAIVKQWIVQSVLQTPAWGCGVYKIGCGQTRIWKQHTVM